MLQPWKREYVLPPRGMRQNYRIEAGPQWGSRTLHKKGSRSNALTEKGFEINLIIVSYKTKEIILIFLPSVCCSVGVTCPDLPARQMRAV